MGVADATRGMLVGGPIASPGDAQYILDRVKGVDGFYGASSMERLPTEVALTAQVRDFVNLRLPATQAAGAR